MANWVYPLGTANDGDWDISLGTSDSALAVDGWAHTGLKVATLVAGAAVELPAAAEERIVVPLNGAFTVTVDDVDYPLRGGRRFSTAPAMSCIPARTPLSPSARPTAAASPSRPPRPTRHTPLGW